MADDCIHHLALCPTCGGLDAVRLDRLPGVTGITYTLNDGSTTTSHPTAVYVGPASTPCNPDDDTDDT